MIMFRKNKMLWLTAPILGICTIGAVYAQIRKPNTSPIKPASAPVRCANTLGEFTTCPSSNAPAPQDDSLFSDPQTPTPPASTNRATAKPATPPATPTEPVSPDPEASTELFPAGRYRNTVFNTLTSHLDITYKSSFHTVVYADGDGKHHIQYDTNDPRDLKVNIYEPAGDTQSLRPLLIFVHCGAWIEGDRTQRDNDAKFYAQLGYVTATIDYTLLPNGDVQPTGDDAFHYGEVIREGTLDLYDAYQYLLSQASTYRIDTSRAGIGGWSAGGFNANVLTHSRDFTNMNGLRATIGASDIYPLSTTGLFGGVRVFDSNYNPVTMLASFSIDTGYSGGSSFEADCAALNDVGHTCIAEVLPGAGHDVWFHLEPLRDPAVDFFATQVTGY